MDRLTFVDLALLMVGGFVFLWTALDRTEWTGARTAPRRITLWFLAVVASWLALIAVIFRYSATLPPPPPRPRAGAGGGAVLVAILVPLAWLWLRTTLEFERPAKPTNSDEAAVTAAPSARQRGRLRRRRRPARR